MSQRPFSHFAAIDWSGAVGSRQRGIAVAICAAGDVAPALVRPGHVWSREEVLDWLLHDMPTDTLVGLDLGPGLPFADAGGYFPGWTDSPPDAPSLWAIIDRLASDDPHLAASSVVDHPGLCEYFRRHGGRRGTLFGQHGQGRFRVTELAQRTQGLNPYSGFNLVGAAQVGKSSLTGMRVLHRLERRLPIWPFDPVPNAGSLIVEIYTSIAALAAGRAKGRTKMRSYAELNAALTHRNIASAPVAGTGPIDDHASDALLTAAWLRRATSDPALWAPPALTPDIARTEGWTFGVR
jgi:hypothetical protein